MQSLVNGFFQSLVFWGMTLWGDLRPCDEPAGYDRQEPLSLCVQQLGDPVFLRRETAYQELLSRGTETLPAILIGLGSCDPEIRARCVQLWTVIQRSDYERRAAAWLRGDEADNEVGFPGWARFSKRVGDSPPTRRLFVEMHASESVLLAQLVAASEQLKPQLGMRLRALKLQLETDHQRFNIQLGSVATLLYIACEVEDTFTAQDGETLQKLAAVPIVQDNLQPNYPLRILWLSWQEVRSDQRFGTERLMGYVRDGLKLEAESLARAVLGDDGSSADTQQYALLVLADSLEPSDRELLTRFLDDDSPLGVYLADTQIIKTELRDVALAAVIQSSGEDPRRFGFRRAKQGAYLAYSPVTLGFACPAERMAAFDTWGNFQRQEFLGKKDR